MPYNSIISRADSTAIIPVDIASEIISNVAQMNPVLKMARKLPNLSAAQRRTPVMSALATAFFVTGDTGLKQTSEVNWANRFIDAEEISVIVPIPEAVLDDSSFDVWAQVKPAIEEAISVCITNAVLFGTNIPASWTTNMGGAGLFAVCTTAGHVVSAAAYTDLYEAVLGMTGAGVLGQHMLVEQDGYMITGSIAHPSMRGLIRNTRDADGNPIFKDNLLDGNPIYFPTDNTIPVATALMISGQWSEMVYAFRQDVTYKILDQAVIQDNTGAIVYNLAQQDMVALRAVIRMGVALPNPINRMNAVAATRCAFGILTA